MALRADVPGPTAEVLGYFLKPLCFIVATRDADPSASALLPLNDLQVITSDGGRPQVPGSPEVQELDEGVSDKYVDQLVEAFLDNNIKRGFVETPHALVLQAFNDHVADTVGLAFDQLPGGCALVRSSNTWNAEEIDGQLGRLRTTIYEMLRMGIVPKWIISDDLPGTIETRPGLCRFLGRAITGAIDGVFVHEIDRFSRHPVAGMPLLVLSHLLTGRLVFYSAKAEQFVEFNPNSFYNLSLAAEEMIQAAIEAARLRGRMERGVENRIRRTKAYGATFGRRRFHEAERPTGQRVRPITTPARAATYLMHAFYLDQTPNLDVRDALAWQLDTYPLDYEFQICSSWNKGFLVQAKEDWQPSAGREALSIDDLQARHLPGMATAPGRIVDRVRQAFQAIRREPARLPPQQVRASRKLEAFREAFSPLARHLATGLRKRPLAPGGGPDIILPGSDPLRCEVEACGGIAYVVQARRGLGEVEEAVCESDSSHRWNPFAGTRIHRASEAGEPICPYCLTNPAFPGKARRLPSGQVLVPFFCPACPEYFFLPMRLNRPLRMDWIAQGSHLVEVNRALVENGWETADEITRPLQTKWEPIRMDAVALERDRVDAKLTARIGQDLRAKYGHEISDTMLRLRFRIFEDLQEGFCREPNFYVHYAVQYLGCDEAQMWARIGHEMEFFRKRGYEVAPPQHRRARGAEREMLRTLLETDLQGRGFQGHAHYLMKLEEFSPDMTPKARKVLLSKLIKQCRAGPWGHLLPQLPGDRSAELRYLRRTMGQDWARDGALRSIAEYIRMLDSLAPGHAPPELRAMVRQVRGEVLLQRRGATRRRSSSR